MVEDELLAGGWNVHSVEDILADDVLVMEVVEVDVLSVEGWKVLLHAAPEIVER